jgi:lipopolysaccharide export LptBFGC system permease protein LptF
VIDPAAELPTNEDLALKRTELQDFAREQQRKITGLIHFRLGFASSALVTILMGAALGVAFRGSRALAAFGLACIPFGAVVIIMVMGRQLTESEATQTIGPFVIWAGLAFVALADIVILRLGVRR